MGRRPKIETLETRITALQVEIAILNGKNHELRSDLDYEIGQRDRLQAEVASRDIALSQSETLRKNLERQLVVTKQIRSYLFSELCKVTKV